MTVLKDLVGAGEEDQVRKILTHAHLSVVNAKWTDPHTKANALLQAHFSRSHISPDLQSDQRFVVPLATRLLQVSSFRIGPSNVKAHVLFEYLYNFI